MPGWTFQLIPQMQSPNLACSFMTKPVSIFIILTFAFFASFGQTQKGSLYVFVGEKIEVSQFYPKADKNFILMDGAFKAKYKIIQNIYGNYKGDTIQFEAYDHFGEPAFSKYKYVLLFVSVYNGKLYHEKYQFFDVYKTKNGRWASSYKVDDYEHSYNKNTPVKPELIDFEKEVSYNIKGRSKEDVEHLFPSPYFKIADNKAIAVYGNYAEQLFELKKTGVLKERGIFD